MFKGQNVVCQQNGSALRLPRMSRQSVCQVRHSACTTRLIVWTVADSLGLLNLNLVLNTMDENALFSGDFHRLTLETYPQNTRLPNTGTAQITPAIIGETPERIPCTKPGP